MGQALGTKSFIRRLKNILIAISATTILAMMVLTGIDVLGRYVFSAPVPGAFELTEFGMAIAVFSALPIVSLQRKHITADLLTGSLNRYLQKAQRVFCDSCGFCFFAFVAWRLWLQAGQTMEYGTTAGLLELPLAPLSYFAAVLSAVNAAIFIAHIFGISSGWGKSDAP